MKKLLFSFLFLCLAFFLTAQDWTWMKGTNLINQYGVYGTMGVAASANNPGSRHGTATWTDAAGNLWMFGGEGLGFSGTSGWLNDLWKYDITSGNWTWIRGSNVKDAAGAYGTKGVASSGNEPGAREFSNYWKDASGNFWLFGGDGFDGSGVFGNLNDLWKYDPIANQWTWMRGSNAIDQTGVYGTPGVSSPLNEPGSRYASAIWTDASGNFWMFGGLGFPASGTVNGHLSDLWKYDVSSNQWTYIKGNTSINTNGIYGTQGTAAAGNLPGGREFASGWIDASGRLWMQGGNGFPATAGAGYLNDLWRFNPSTNNWTWIKGSNLINQAGVYGSQGVPNTANMPGGREAGAYWTDAAGNFWWYGGLGYASSPTLLGRGNDLWKYNIGTNEWAWIKGANVVNKYATYGTKGVSSASNTPGSRYYTNMWNDNAGNFWMFAGFGFAVAGAPGNTEDLWKFNVSCAAGDISADSNKVICSGSSASLTAVTSGSGTISWYASQTSTTSLGTGINFTTPTLTTGISPSTYTFFAEASSCSVTARTEIIVTVDPLPPVSVNSSHTLLCTGQSATLNASGASSYTWNTSVTGSSIIVSPSVTTNYTVFGLSAEGCSNTSTITQLVSNCTGMDEFDLENKLFVYPNPSNGSFRIYQESPSVLQEKGQITLFDLLGREVFTEKVTGETIVTHLSPGFYDYRISVNDQLFTSGRIIIQH
jgi:N-acetylneuraminic acid mutarotase